MNVPSCPACYVDEGPFPWDSNMTVTDKHVTNVPASQTLKQDDASFDVSLAESGTTTWINYKKSLVGLVCGTG